MVTGSFSTQKGETSFICSVNRGRPEEFVILTNPESYQPQAHKKLNTHHVIVLDSVTNVGVLRLTCKTLTILSDLGGADGGVFVEAARFVLNFTGKQVISSEPCIQKIKVEAKVLSSLSKAVRGAVDAQDVSAMIDALGQVILVRDQSDVASGLRPLSEASRDLAFNAFFNRS